MSKALLLIGLLFLTGCSSWFVEQPKGPWAIYKQEFRQCLADLKDDRELKAIANKVTLESNYDRDEYFDLLGIEDRPTAKEKVAIKKWASKLERCYKIKAQCYAYEPPDVALWSAASDSEQMVLILELHKGNLSYGQFAAKRLEVDTTYRGKILQAITAGYKKSEKAPELLPQPKNNEIPRKPLTTL
jgi:hypothetical protein